MVGHELIPNIVEKVGDIKWDEAIEFFKRLVGGVRPDEGLPVADEVAADGGEGWGRSPAEQKEWAEYDAALEALNNKGDELLALIETAPTGYAPSQWITYIGKVVEVERELIPLLEKQVQEGLDLRQFGHGFTGSNESAQIQVLNASIKTLEGLKASLEGLDPDSGRSFLRAVPLMNEAKTEIVENLPANLENPQPVRVGSIGG